jgi:hypothetical protein
MMTVGGEQGNVNGVDGRRVGAIRPRLRPATTCPNDWSKSRVYKEKQNGTKMAVEYEMYSECKSQNISVHIRDRD